ncbi:UNVERIFIED_CONTAM: hypothetical protein HDU68_007946 [Siphonaria sp. JEL0065]|nr:hypothetical protein HDU68_007946 [Siphonaria sp. JEL0065]
MLPNITGKTVMQPFLRSYATTRLGKMNINGGGSNNSHNNQQPPKQESAWSRMSLGQKVLQSGKNTGYLGVILGGVGLAGLSLSYVVFDFIEDYQSSKLFDDAFEKVIDMVGTPMKGHGGLGPRGAPTNPKRTIYKDEQGGEKQVIMYFVLEGPNGKGTAYVNQIKNQEGEYEYNVLSADVQRHGMRSAKRVFIIDNRMKRSSTGPRKGWFGRPLWRKEKEPAQ